MWQACRFVEAVDGVDAVEKFIAFLPDLVLLDINMPRKDGFAAASEMRAFESKLVRSPARDADDRSRRPFSAQRGRAYIIAVTAMSSEANKRRGLVECGIDEWRIKPVQIRDLRDDVEKMKQRFER